MKKVAVHGRRRLLDGFFQVDELTLSHELLDGRMSRPLRRLVLERGDAVASGAEILCSGTDSFDIIP